MSNSHTPGPWSVAPNGHCVFTDAFKEGRGVALCAMNARTPEEIVANARLISAAPDLLAAMKQVMEMLNSGALVRDISKDHHPDYAIRALNLVRTITQWQTAIAKAEGSR